MRNIKKGLFLSVLFMVIILAVNAQKLPNVQKISLLAPDNIKIDGKATEWGDKFQAYNNAIQVFYTVANDTKRIYLVVHTDRREIINKIINGGISFTVKKAGKKNIDGGPTITYPVFSGLKHPSINFTAMSEIAPGEKDAAKKKDSLVAISNAGLEEKAKYIRAFGVPGLDTLISIYNTDGIKAHSAFDTKMGYTVEIAVDLKLFSLSAHDLVSFNYNIMLNGVQYDYIPGVDIKRDGGGTITSMSINSNVANMYSGATNATDCWGEYTLAR